MPPKGVKKGGANPHFVQDTDSEESQDEQEAVATGAMVKAEAGLAGQVVEESEEEQEEAEAGAGVEEEEAAGARCGPNPQGRYT